ncbi:hypothetical protein IFM47457_00346 [Aspergillus lentulus]|nr:hypothetical protein IFM47457_00346 [Aspergillus lentulus]
MAEAVGIGHNRVIWRLKKKAVLNATTRTMRSQSMHGRSPERSVAHESVIHTNRWGRELQSRAARLR